MVLILTAKNSWVSKTLKIEFDCESSWHSAQCRYQS
jgi:hypothetical protein